MNYALNSEEPQARRGRKAESTIRVTRIEFNEFAYRCAISIYAASRKSEQALACEFPDARSASSYRAARLMTTAFPIRNFKN